MSARPRLRSRTSTLPAPSTFSQLVARTSRFRRVSRTSAAGRATLPRLSLRNYVKPRRRGRDFSADASLLIATKVPLLPLVPFAQRSYRVRTRLSPASSVFLSREDATRLRETFGNRPMPRGLAANDPFIIHIRVRRGCQRDETFSRDR